MRDDLGDPRLLIESLPDAVVLYDSQGKVIYVNPAFVETYGWSRAECLGRRMDFVPPEEEQTTLNNIARTLSGETVEFETRRLTKSGDLKDIHIKTAPFRSAGGQVIGSYVIHRDITERRRTEAALLQSEERNLSLLEASPDPISVYDDQGRVTYVNPAFEQTFGWSKEELAGRGIDFVPPHEMERTMQAVKRTLAGESVLLETQRVTKSGKLLDIQLKTAIFHDRQGRLAGDMVIYRDVSRQKRAERELKQHRDHLEDLVSERTRELQAANRRLRLEVEERGRAEEALRDSERRLADIIDFLPDPTWAIDGKGRVVAWNHALEELTGVPAEEMLGQGDYAHAIAFYGYRRPMLIDLLRNPDQEIESKYLSFTREEDCLTAVSHIPNLSAKGIYLSAKAGPLYDATGKRVGAIESLRDITQIKKGEEAFRASEQRFRDLFDSINDLIYSQDLEGRFLSLNQAVARVFGYSVEELKGKKASEMMLPQHRQGFEEVYLARIMKDGRFEGVSQYLTKQGKVRYLEYRSTLVTPEDGEPYISGTGRDVTDRALAEREMKHLQRQLQHAQKMQAIGTLAGGVAHDFNNILQAMNGYLEAIARGAGLAAKDQRRLDQVSKLIERASGLIRQLLTFSRRLEPEMRQVDLNHEIRQAAEILERTIPKMITIETRLAADLHPVSGDPSQLEQILLNLGSNARDAMPEGGKLIFQTENLVLDEEFCQRNPGLRPGPHVLLTVSDSGHGMTPEVLEQIFNPFFTTKPVGQGTGLGLSMVYGICKTHGGHVTCESRPGKGTAFAIYLPAAPEGQSRDRPATPAAQGASCSVTGATVMVVDDEKDILATVREGLEDFGCRVITASTGEEALERYRELEGQVDLVILDIGMPGMGGVACLRELKRLDPDLPVIISSGYCAEGQIQELMDQGATAYLTKPYMLAGLLAEVDGLLAGGAGGA
ncbi:hypothetical protein AAU61_20225 [Desulfocarbo indianensis]|nr:hypothetical protein AAU61_20225 [Desulfocarbo indianensis]